MKIFKTPLFIGIGILILGSCSTDDDEPMMAVVNEDPVVSQNQIATLEGQIEFLNEPPPSVVLDQLKNDTLIYVFAEKQNHTLRTAIRVDLSMPGDFFPDSVPKDEQTWEALMPGDIPAGTVVDSYYFHYDNETYNDTFDTFNYLNCIGQYQVNAKIVFKKPVLGIAMRAETAENATLNNSNTELGLESVEYDEKNFLHFPGINIADGCQSDRFILSEDRLTLTVRNNSDIHHDNYRVILKAD